MIPEQTTRLCNKQIVVKNVVMRAVLRVIETNRHTGQVEPNDCDQHKSAFDLIFKVRAAYKYPNHQHRHDQYDNRGNNEHDLPPLGIYLV